MKDFNIDNITGPQLDLQKIRPMSLCWMGNSSSTFERMGIVKNDAVALSAAASSEIAGF